MRAEDKYKAQLQALGIWQDAFAPEVHTLCVMERELRREMKNLNALSTSDRKSAEQTYAIVMQLRRDILAHRDALGLTPKSFKRLRGEDFGASGGVTIALTEEALANGG